MKHELELFASVEVHKQLERKAFISSLKKYGITPNFLDDKIEFRYIGSRDVVSRLITICDEIQAHSIHVSAVD